MNKKTYVRIGLIACMICIMMLCVYQIKTKNYKKIDALITNATTETNYNQTEKGYSTANYDIYTYTINKQTYNTKMQVWKKGKVGDHIVVRYDPVNPKRLYSNFKRNVLIGLIIFTGIFTFGVSICDEKE